MLDDKSNGIDDASFIHWHNNIIKSIGDAGDYFASGDYTGAKRVLTNIEKSFNDLVSLDLTEPQKKQAEKLRAMIAVATFAMTDSSEIQQQSKFKLNAADDEFDIPSKPLLNDSEWDELMMIAADILEDGFDAVKEGHIFKIDIATYGITTQVLPYLDKSTVEREKQSKKILLAYRTLIKESADMAIRMMKNIEKDIKTRRRHEMNG